MPKILLRIIAFVLVPCLLADPALSVAIPRSFSSVADVSLFSHEAFALRAAWITSDRLNHKTPHLKVLLSAILLLAPLKLHAQNPAQPMAATHVLSSEIRRIPDAELSSIQVLADMDNSLEDRTAALESLSKLSSVNAEKIIPALSAIAQNPYDDAELRLKTVRILTPFLDSLPREEGADLSQARGLLKDIYIQSGIMVYGAIPIPFAGALKQFIQDAPPGIPQTVQAVVSLDEETYQSLYRSSVGGFDQGIIVLGLSQTSPRSGFVSHRVSAALKDPSYFMHHEFGHADRKGRLSNAEWKRLTLSYETDRTELLNLISMACTDSEETFAEVFATWFEHSDKLFLDPAVGRVQTARLFIEEDAKSFMFDHEDQRFIRFYVSGHPVDVPLPPGTQSLSYPQLVDLYKTARETPPTPTGRIPSLDWLSPLLLLSAAFRKKWGDDPNRYYSDDALEIIHKSLMELSEQTPGAILLAAMRPAASMLQPSSMPYVIVIQDYETAGELEEAQRKLRDDLNRSGLAGASHDLIRDPVWLPVTFVRRMAIGIARAFRAASKAVASFSDTNAPIPDVEKAIDKGVFAVLHRGSSFEQKGLVMRYVSLALHHYKQAYKNDAFFHAIPQLPIIPEWPPNPELFKLTEAALMKSVKEVLHSQSDPSRKTIGYTTKKRLEPAQRYIVAALLRHHSLDQPLTVVDVGVGDFGAPTTFDLAQVLSIAGFKEIKVVGIDMESIHVKKAQGNNLNQTLRTGVSVDFKEGGFNLEALGLKNVDLVTVGNVLLHYPNEVDQRKAYALLRKVLKPDGLLAVLSGPYVTHDTSDDDHKIRTYFDIGIFDHNQNILEQTILSAPGYPGARAPYWRSERRVQQAA